MSGLRRGHRRLASLAGTALLVCAGLIGAVASPAGADTIGGEQLASPRRTVALQPGADPLPEVWAETWILADADSGEVLAQKGSHVQRAPASTLKMLTALAVMPNTSPDDTYVATRRAANIYGARVGLKPGKTYTLDDLWYAVFLPSANDAAIAVAQANGGVRRTVEQMNDVATELNARDTVARNTSGLDARGQLSSAYDLALMARAGLQRTDFSSYARTARATFPDVKGKGRHPIYTTNRLLLSDWRGVIGVKTGFTSQAGRTFVGAAERKGRTYLVALMGIHESSETAARKLLAWAFDNADRVTPIGQLVEPGPLPTTADADVPAASVSDVASSTTGATATSAAAAGEPGASLPVAPIVIGLFVAGAVAAGVWLRAGAGAGRHAA